MRMVDIITDKRDGKTLSNEQISFVVRGYVENKIPDYQISSLLMAILFNGMNKEELATLTNEMMHSGDVFDLSSIKGIKVDKHSTGGVGDKTSLVLGPLVASCGAKLAKMSGRGLGHTGGTLDKMESIPGLRITLSEEEFIKQVNDVGLAIIGQTGTLVPADKKLYALRDVTGTVESIPLIASSIMSKKLASGSDTILLDVKVGSGAFMKDMESARTLANTMVEIGKSFNKDTRAILTDMDEPLGLAVGNSLEVIEAINTLKGNGPEDFVSLCLKAASIMLTQAKITKNEEEAFIMLNENIKNGKALKCLKDLVRAQGGDVSYIDDTSKFPVAKNINQIIAKKDGYVKRIVALQIGECAMKLGAGRATKESDIDLSAGIVLNKKIGHKVKKGDVLATSYTNIDGDISSILEDINNAFVIVDEEIKTPEIIKDYIK